MQVDTRCNKPATNDQAKLTVLHVKSRQSSATSPACNLPHLHLAPPLGVTQFEFCQDFCIRVAGLLCGVVCMIVRLAVSVEHHNL